MRCPRGNPHGPNGFSPTKLHPTMCVRRSSAAVATSREGHRSRSRARSLGTPQQLALRLFQAAPRPHRDCRRLRQLLNCEHTLQSFSDRRRPQTNIHSSARFAAPRTRATSKPLMMRFIMAAPDEASAATCGSSVDEPLSSLDPTSAQFNKDCKYGPWPATCRPAVLRKYGRYSRPPSSLPRCP
jgi:hypothetical protein